MFEDLDLKIDNSSPAKPIAMKSIPPTPYLGCVIHTFMCPNPI